MKKAFVIQDVDSKGFLTSSRDGDICFTPWIKDAFRFETAEAAVHTALFQCDSGYQVFEFYQPEEIDLL